MVFVSLSDLFDLTWHPLGLSTLSQTAGSRSFYSSGTVHCARTPCPYPVPVAGRVGCFRTVAAVASAAADRAAHGSLDVGVFIFFR